MFEKRDREVHKMDYKKQISELLQSVTDEKILRRIYLMIVALIGAGRQDRLFFNLQFQDRLS
mgnify:CR=1 FL=1